MPFTFTAANNIPFTARRVNKMDSYGLDDCMLHCESEPLIEFYDARYPHSQYGQFISRYSLSTLRQCPPDSGLNLQGGVNDWEIDAASLQAVLASLGQ